MATPEKREHPSTYIVQDRQNQRELERLTIQDQMITTSMGGVLPEQGDPAAFHRVLDIGCGSGSWLMDAAQAYPDMALFGIDISSRMIDYARAQAREKQVNERVEFRVMDALRMLEFPAGFFDLVNLRFGISFMRTWDWPKMLSEMQRVTRPGGVIRVTDQEVIHLSNSAANTQIHQMTLCAMFRSGHLFEQETSGLTAHLATLLKQHGVRQVQTKTYALEFRAGTPQGQAYFDDMSHAYHTVLPFFQKWGCAPENYNEIRQQALSDIQHNDFHVTWNLLTAWGSAPE